MEKESKALLVKLRWGAEIHGNSTRDIATARGVVCHWPEGCSARPLTASTLDCCVVVSGAIKVGGSFQLLGPEVSA